MAETAGPEGVNSETTRDGVRAAPADGGDALGAAPGRPRGVSPNEAMSSLLDTLRLGIVILDTRRRVMLWSGTAEEILGRLPGRLVGKPVESFLRPFEGMSPEQQAEDIFACLRRERRWRGILRVHHAEGHPVTVESRAFLLSDGAAAPYVALSLADVGQLRAIDHDLAALHALFGSSPLGIALFDTELRYVRVNEALARLNGVPAGEHLGKTVHDVLPPGMAEEITQVQSTVLRTGRSVIDLVTNAPDGIGARSVSYSRLTDDFGQVLGLSCAVMDVSERRDALEKIERARQRLALLDHVGVALGDFLDVRNIAQALATALVPRFADYAGVMLVGNLAHGGDLPGRTPTSGTPLLQLGVAARDRGPSVRRMLRIGQDIAFESGSYFGRTLSTGAPHLITSQEELRAATYADDPKVVAALDLGIHSLMVVPLRARGIVLGLLVVSRATESDPFDHDDLALAMELADRAGTSLDNARLYAREREGALMLQRTLLPQSVPSPPGVQVAYRYVPGSSGTEVGGDWFDVIPLAGGRVALVVGDVTGHGLRAAATMGRLRTAVRTLAGLDLPPDELLRRVNDLADDLAPGPDDPLLATAVYAVYDPSTRRCHLAKAGHVPPLLLMPGPEGGWRSRVLDLPSGAPLGVDGVHFETTELEVEDGAVLVLYTDGLIENRGEDITDGIERLRDLLCARTPAPSLDDACDAVVATRASSGARGDGSRGAFAGAVRLGDEPHRSRSASPSVPVDDAALLMAQLGGLPEGSAASWTFSAESYAVRRARSVVRDTLRDWNMRELIDSTELLVSELVTNSLRYAHGPIGVRMVRGGSLLVEVSDPLPDPPQPRSATEEDEGGRGIQLVARESRRWGTRHGPLGKTVWFELPLPG
ncbi:SpoIIE family protein phosphatase [Streptomyces sp. RKND-216]|uniref:SpoIIE family protein phosphatase n=1 Tax=Streptomyces sp. RKND-216 TaxID=2562581 RepID=UPI0032B342CD